MDNLDQTQEKLYVDQTNEPETNPLQEVRIKRPAAIIKYPPTPPTIKETEASTRTIHRPINLEEDSEGHSDDDEFHDSLTQMEPNDDKLSDTETNTESKAQPKKLDRELKNLRSINPPGSSEVVQGTAGTRIRLPTLPNARFLYSCDAVQDELDDFFEQSYDFK